MLSAPATRPAMPATSTGERSEVAPATPITMPATETIPSLAPRTPARNQFSRFPTSSPMSSCQCCGSSSVPISVLTLSILPTGARRSQGRQGSPSSVRPRRTGSRRGPLLPSNDDRLPRLSVVAPPLARRTLLAGGLAGAAGLLEACAPDDAQPPPDSPAPSAQPSPSTSRRPPAAPNWKQLAAHV